MIGAAKKRSVCGLDLPASDRRPAGDLANRDRHTVRASSNGGSHANIMLGQTLCVSGWSNLKRWTQ